MPRPMGRNGKGKGKGKDLKGKREKSTSLFKRKKFCRFTAERSSRSTTRTWMC